MNGAPSTSNALVLATASKKRRNEDPERAGRAPKRPNVSGGSAKSPRTKAPRKRPPSQRHRLTKQDLPEGGKELMDAFNTHIRILMNFLDPNTAPPLADGGVVGQFNGRFTDASDVFRDRFTKPSEHQRALLDTIAKFRANPGKSKIATNAARVEEHILHTVITSQCHFGLSAFRPDFFSTPYSPYNSAHRIFAIDSFKQVAVCGAYYWMRPRLSLLNDMSFMTEAYDHIVHYDFQNLAKLERRNGEGSVAAQHMKDNVYQRRSRTQSGRETYMREEEHAAPRFVDLVGDPLATSDDEVTSATTCNALEKPKRSRRITQYVASIDARRIALAESKPGYRLRERKRLRPANPEVSKFRTLPRPGIPLDYFGPEIFNALPYPIRRRYSHKPRIALPKKDVDVWSRKYMEMSDEDFMKGEGGELLKQYDIVNDVSGDEGVDDEMEVDDEEPGAPELEQQVQFAALMDAGGPSGSGSS